MIAQTNNGRSIILKMSARKSLSPLIGDGTLSSKFSIIALWRKGPHLCNGILALEGRLRAGGPHPSTDPIASFSRA
jgi:hypothetical protein